MGAVVILSLGGVLQLAGIAAIVYEVYVADRKAHGRSLWQRLRQWRPFARRQPVVVRAEGAWGIALGGRPRVKVTPAPGRTIGQRVDELEREAQRLSDGLAGLRDSHDDLSRQIDYHVDRLRGRVDDVATDLRRAIDIADAGHVWLRVFSACAIALGVVYATWAAQIAGTTPGTVIAWILFVVVVAVGAVAWWDTRRSSSAQGQDS